MNDAYLSQILVELRRIADALERAYPDPKKRPVPPAPPAPAGVRAESGLPQHF